MSTIILYYTYITYIVCVLIAPPVGVYYNSIIIIIINLNKVLLTQVIETRSSEGVIAGPLVDSLDKWGIRLFASHTAFARSITYCISYYHHNCAVHGIGFLSKHSLGTRPLSGLDLGLAVSFLS